MPIRILDAATVGRIAAGEVVERPASVVKELVENALDAGATSITVEIRGGGIDYLRVTDNGCGIEPGQVRLAFENHATSKLRDASELDDIRTMGFRGEALPSIAAVSHVEMTTRPRTQETGTRLNIDGGKDIRVKEIGCPEGTTIVMRDLFYNVPVRRAFLKKPGYEGGLVSDAVARLMIANPKISMRFISNSNTVYHSFGDGKPRHAVFAVYGKQAAERMVEVDAAEGGTRISGLIGVGDLSKSTRAHELFFINGRVVRCALLSRALEEVCRTRVTIGMYPMCALSLTLPPHAIDVNVHPNKLEVRFRDEDSTRTTVEALLRTAFEGEKVLSIEKETAPVKEIARTSTVRRLTPVPNDLPFDTPKPGIPVRPATVSEPVRETSAPVHEPVAATPTEVTATVSPTAEKPAKKPVMPPLPGMDLFRAAIEQERERLSVSTREPGEERLRETAYAIPTIGSSPQPRLQPERENVVSIRLAEETDVPYRVIGVVLKTYILIEANDSLLLVDQHAAHERLRYERYCRQLEEGNASQQLLTPLILRLSAREMALIRDNMDTLSEAGYTVELFGENDIRVTAVPHVLGKAELRPIFLEMINCLSHLRAATLDARRAEIMQMSCKGAVKGGDALTPSEIDALVREMLETDAPSTCPHGRPVVRTLSRKDLEKMFKRIQ